MAKIQEEFIVVKLSRLVKTEDSPSIINDDFLSDVEIFLSDVIKERSDMPEGIVVEVVEHTG